MERRWLAVVIGTLGVYFLIHAGVIGWGVYEFPLVDERLTATERNLNRTLMTSFAVFTAFGTSSIIAVIGVVRNSKWAQPLWLTTSVAIVGAVLLAVVIWEVEWTHYLYELTMVAVSCWYMLTIARKERRDV
jgi:hypothetical protein